MPFDQCIEVGVTNRTAREHDVMLSGGAILGQIEDDDVLLCTFYVRCLESSDESALGKFTITSRARHPNRWLDFFADAVIETCSQAVDTVQRLLALAEADRKRIQELGRISGSVQVTHHAIMERPIASPVWLRDKTGLSLTTIGTSLERLEGLGIVKELTGKKRNRLYAYTQYISIMNQGTEL